MADRVKKPIAPSLIHEKINLEASKIATDLISKDPGLRSITFRFPGLLGPAAPPKIGLVFREGIVNVLEEWEVELIRDIGREALRRAIISKGEDFVGLIIGEARKNRDYFAVHHRS